MDYYEALLKVLEEVLSRKQNICDSWKDSGDRGACYHHEVRPIEELIEETKKRLKAL